MLQLRLSIVHGPETGKSYLLGETTRLGRALDNDIHIPDTQTSRYHAIIEHRENGYVIRDLDSTNGTFVNGKRVDREMELHIGDAITVGKTRFIVLVR